jgi:hypothetical protein
MKVNSTGLGNTTLTAHISGLQPGDEPGLLVMKIESTKPVHWFITCRMEPEDIRTAIKMVLKPAAIGRILKLMFSFPRRNAEPEPAVEAKRNG